MFKKRPTQPYLTTATRVTPKTDVVYNSIRGIWKDRKNLETMLVRLRKILISNPDNIAKLSSNKLLKPNRTTRISQVFDFPTFSVGIRPGLFNGIRLYIFFPGKSKQENVDFILFTNTHRSAGTIVKEDCDSFNNFFFNSDTVTKGYAPEEVLGELDELICDYTTYGKELELKQEVEEAAW